MCARARAPCVCECYLRLCCMNHVCAQWTVFLWLYALRRMTFLLFATNGVRSLVDSNASLPGRAVHFHVPNHQRLMDVVV